MGTQSIKKKDVIEYSNKNAKKRDRFIKRNSYYYKDLLKFFKHTIPTGKSILEIGCGTGHLLNSLKPKNAYGVDISPEMIKLAKRKYGRYKFYEMDAEKLSLNEKFDYVIISDTLCYLEDIQALFKKLKNTIIADTRIIITYHNFLWHPIFIIAEILRLKMPVFRLNWLNRDDVNNILNLEGYEVIKQGKRFLFPKKIPIISWIFNKYLAYLPLINELCITGYTIARLKGIGENDNAQYSVSVVVPAMNEKGNIENVVKRIPAMGKHTEIIFVEGNSIDDTLEEIKNICQKYSKTHDVRYIIQDGKGKGDAVRKGFAMAKGDILMILDADLTVPPEDLTKFYNAIATGTGEYINGTRLVYPMEKEAMRLLNILGNKFFSLVFSWLLGQKIKDTLCGTKVLFKKDWDRIVENRKYFGDFDPFGDFDIIFGSAKLNLKLIEVPIRYQAREYGRTNISRFRHGWLLLKMVFFAINKLKFV